MQIITLRDRFTKQGKLARERYSKTVQMGVEIYAGDLLTLNLISIMTAAQRNLAICLDSDNVFFWNSK